MGLSLVVGLGAILIAAWADTHPKATTAALPALDSTSAVSSKAEDPTSAQALHTIASPDPSAPQTRRSAAFYSQGISSGLFSEPQPPEPKAATPPPPPKPVEVTPPDTEPSIVPETPVNPYADWSYNGLVTMGDQMMALLENTKTKEGQYVQTGDNFLGAKVENVTDQMVALRDSGKLYTLSKSETITVVPLDKSAPYLAENSSQPQTGTPQEAQAQTPQAPSMPNGLANMTPDQLAAMMQNRRQFRGMGRGRGMGGGFNGQQMFLPKSP
ncbi:MAG TPA: hypothetical protein VFA07_03110 [Chthonomonadaceae bacterium]|nr:hypothetical protein [Chthonomonadaceae bacterium]